MKNVLYLVFLLLFLITGCSEKKGIVDPQESKAGGQILLQIDKENAPVGITKVIATLSRQGYKSVTGEMNLLSDTSAAITLNNIAVGSWHLKIEAGDSLGTIRYKGEADVIISEGMTTQISLTLQPVSSGMGGISVKVTWGSTSQKKWTDYSGNPVLVNTGNYWDKYGCYSPKIMVENGLYKMWFTSYTDNSVAYVGYAESNDGINWYRPVAGPVLSPGPEGAWDCGRVVAGPVIKENGTYIMYYLGWISSDGAWKIGLAVSSDGIHWKKHSYPALEGTAPDELRMHPNELLKIKNIYYLYYTYGTGSGVPAYKIGLATSTDGYRFTKHPNNPIISVTSEWEADGVGTPTILSDNGVYKMVYDNWSLNPDHISGFGLATSTDGKSWKKDPANPFFRENDPTIKWSVEETRYPCFIKTGAEYRIYYSGYNYSIKQYKIGYIRKPI